MPSPMTDTTGSRPSGGVDDSAVRDASKFVDEILGISTPGSSEPASGTLSETPSLTDSMDVMSGSKTMDTGAGDGSGEPASSDMSALLPMVAGDADKAAKLYAVSQRRPTMTGKSPSEVAGMLRSNVNLRMDLMADLGMDEDNAAMDMENAKVSAPTDLAGVNSMQKSIDRPY